MEGYDIFGNPLPDVATEAVATAASASDVPEIDEYRTKALDRAREFEYTYDRYNPNSPSPFSFDYQSERAQVRDDDTPLENIYFLARMATQFIERLQTQSPKDLDESSMAQLLVGLRSMFTVLGFARGQVKKANKNLEEGGDMDKYDARIRNAGIAIEDITRNIENSTDNNFYNILRSRNPNMTEEQIDNEYNKFSASPFGQTIANIGNFGRSFRNYMYEGTESGFNSVDE
jgi:hypothetical protein